MGGRTNAWRWSPKNDRRRTRARSSRRWPAAGKEHGKRPRVRSTGCGSTCNKRRKRRTTRRPGWPQRAQPAVVAALNAEVRSSSLIETVNSALRPLLATSRGQIRQETLDLFADVHNHRRFVRGQRDGGGKGVVSQVTRLRLTTVIDFGLVMKLARKTCVRAGIINLRFHDLRHSLWLAPGGEGRPHSSDC